MTQFPLTRPGRRSASPGRALRRDSWWPWAFIAPAVAGLVVFYVWPIIQTAYFSFTEWGVFGGSTWIGLENYETLLGDPAVLRSILNTFGFTALVLLGVPIAVVMASLINRPGLRFAQLYRVLFFMPYVAMPVAVAIVWRLMFNGDFGILNAALAVVGIDGPHWTSTPGVALVALGIVGLWASIGFNMIILSAGLSAIPHEVYEAAQIDGASGIRTFFSITVPLLAPSIFFVVVITTISGFQVFDLLFALLGANNPAMSQTQSLVYLFYSEGFLSNDKGYAAALAMLILLIIGAVTLVQFRIRGRVARDV
ncbi:carbohydrate ABC transporter permease [Agromyces aerolatus]|uniref:carbohydrate ABC transporter permease n=1 Tax=Agromyces sp. LY-1074 TaxID=3074080 RepID=UPI002864F59A|nr:MULTISPECIES: sugar ABC transporter permease [unclassified Agromyces]MDR5700474.1 sugar ABC transporter permease [Agromyces sp. LY-1074]MDR5706995.1 sugar ABC transporter permease [Agromyces sp. LY-1358]